MATTGQPEAGPRVREDSWWTRSIQLVASWLKRSLADLSCSLCMPFLIVCCPYSRGYRRMSKDYEYKMSSSESMVCLTMIRLLVKRLARTAQAASAKGRLLHAA